MISPFERLSEVGTAIVTVEEGGRATVSARTMFT
jgi:hypothetical protein